MALPLPPDYEHEREERRGLEQRAATLIAAMLVLVGLIASGRRDLVAAGPTARGCLVATVILMAAAILVLAIALMWPSINPASPLSFGDQVLRHNVWVLRCIRVGTGCLALGFTLTTVALAIAFGAPAAPVLGSSGHPVEVHTTP